MAFKKWMVDPSAATVGRLALPTVPIYCTAPINVCSSRLSPGSCDRDPERGGARPRGCVELIAILLIINQISVAGHPRPGGRGKNQQLCGRAGLSQNGIGMENVAFVP